MKWNDTYILLFSRGPEMIRVALGYKARYQTPDTHCFSAQSIPGFSNLSPICLAGATMRSKIIIVAHSNETVIGIDSIIIQGVQSQMKGKQFALHLYRLGLRMAGLLSFKGCSLGQGQFLDELKEALDHVCLCIGNMVAYIGVANLTPWSNNITNIPYWTDVSVGPEDTKLHNNIGDKLPDQLRIRVVKGNVPVLPNIFSARF